MTFDHHLFISYAHVDNKPTSDKSEGWVTRFHECLESYLGHSIGEEARIWRDAKLRGNDEFGPEIEERLPKSAVLVSVISPRYFKSDWCVREVNLFCENAKSSKGLNVGNQVRVFRVLTKSFEPAAFDVFPDLVDHSIGYEFYERDANDREAWLDPDLGSGEAYRLRIYQLADEIADLIHKLEVPAADETETDGLTVYLAECSSDRREDRERIASSLRAHGYRVVPEHRLSTDEAEYIRDVDELLKQADLTVHIVGSSYGLIPDGTSGKSIVELQNEVAAKHAGTSDLKRLIWLPSVGDVQHEDQRAFIQLLRKTPEAQLGADLIEDSLESLKGVMHRTLAQIQSSASNLAPIDESSGRTIYVVCTERDRAATMELRKFLKRSGFEVKIPVFEGKAAAVRQANEHNVQIADAIILFYGEADEAWRATTENELTRLGGMRESATSQKKFTYIAGPESTDKAEMMEMGEENLIDGMSGFSDEIMADFLTALST